MTHKMIHKMIRKKLLMFLTIACAASTLLAAPQTRAAQAHEECSVCDMKIVEQDEARLTVGGKTKDYRCVLCAIAGAKSDYPSGNAVISAPAEPGKRITVKRVNGKWSVSPASAVFLKAGKHKTCPSGYRGFTNKAALAAWAKKNDFPNKPLTLAQMVAVSK